MANLLGTVTAVNTTSAGMQLAVDLALAGSPGNVLASKTLEFDPFTSFADIESAVRQWMESESRKQQWAAAVREKIAVGDRIQLATGQ